MSINMPLVYQVSEDFLTFPLQEELKKYNEKTLVRGKDRVYIDIGDVSISPNEDSMDLFISLIFAPYNDGVERTTVDGVVSKYVKVKNLYENEGRVSIWFSYRKVHERSFINKDFKKNLIEFINKNKSFPIVFRTKKLYKDINYVDELDFIKSTYFRDRETEFQNIFEICDVLTKIATIDHKTIEHTFDQEREPFHEKLTTSHPVIRLTLDKNNNFIADKNDYYPGCCVFHEWEK